jgi:hypothetical protein
VLRIAHPELRIWPDALLVQIDAALTQPRRKAWGVAAPSFADAPPSIGRPAAVLRRRASLASPPGSESSRRASELRRRTSLDRRRLHRRWGPRRRATEPGVPAASTPRWRSERGQLANAAKSLGLYDF